jgi:ketol-acid reductoisomerase
MAKSRIYYDQDADLSVLNDRTIAVIGYGNQGRAQALNLKDSGCKVIIGVLPDETQKLAGKDKFKTYSIAEAAALADILLLLIPDEVMPEVFEKDIRPGLKRGKTVCFASGYNVAFNFLKLPRGIDVVLVAPRMIGAGVRGRYLEGKGFPSFIGVHREGSRKALQTTLAIARGIGSTRSGAIEVTFTQEAVMDLFTEQAFLPAFLQLLTMSMQTLVNAGYAPEAGLIELFLSNEFAYVCDKMVEMGIFKQMALHSHTSQYGQLTRTPRFNNASLLKTLKKVLKEIETGVFAKEWAAEQRAGLPVFSKIKNEVRQSPLAHWERQTRQAFRMV